MAYNQNIPQPNDRLKDSQGQLLANFQEINTFLDVNHVIFGSAGAGKHKFLSMPRQNPVPAAPTGNDGQLYAGLGAVSNNTELFWRRNPAGSLRSFTEGAINSPGWSMFPSGLMMKWARIDTNPTTGAQDINTNAAPFVGPNFAGVAEVQITMSGPNSDTDANTFVRIINVGITTRVYSSQRTTTNPAASLFHMLVLGTRA